MLGPIGYLDDLSMATGGGSLPLFLSILTSSPLTLDLAAQADALELVGNLFSGVFTFISFIYACRIVSEIRSMA